LYFGVIFSGNSNSDNLHHPRSVAYSVELVPLNRHQISGGKAYLNVTLSVPNHKPWYYFGSGYSSSHRM